MRRRISSKDCYAFLNTFNLYLHTYWANWVNSLTILILITLIGKLPFELEGTIPIVSQEGSLFCKTKIDQSTNVYWVPLSPDKIHAYTDTLTDTHSLSTGYKLAISVFFLSLIILSLDLALEFAGCIPLLCAPSPMLQSAHLASIEYLQQKRATDVWALLYFGIVISYHWKKMRNVTKESRGISWLAMPLKLKNIFKTEVFNCKES